MVFQAPPLRRPDVIACASGEEVAELLGVHFASAFTDEPVDDVLPSS